MLNIRNGLALTNFILQRMVDEIRYHPASNILAMLVRRAGIMPNTVTGSVEGKGETQFLSAVATGDGSVRELALEASVAPFDGVFKDDASATNQLRVVADKFAGNNRQKFQLQIPSDAESDVVVYAKYEETYFENAIFELSGDGVLVSRDTGNVGFLLRSGNSGVPQYITFTDADNIIGVDINGLGTYIVESFGETADGRTRIKIADLNDVRSGVIEDITNISSSFIENDRVRIAILGTTNGDDRPPLYIHDRIVVEAYVVPSDDEGAVGFSFSDITRSQAVLTSAFPIHHFKIEHVADANNRITLLESNDVRQENVVSFLCTPQRIYADVTTEESKVVIRTDALNTDAITISGYLPLSRLVNRHDTTFSLPEAAGMFLRARGRPSITLIVEADFEIPPTVVNEEGETEDNPLLPVFNAVGDVMVTDIGTGFFRMRVRVDIRSFPSSVYSDDRPYKVYIPNVTLTVDDFS